MLVPARRARVRQPKPTPRGITAEDIELLEVYVDSERDRAPIAEFAADRAKRLVPVLANLVARWMTEHARTAEHVDQLDACELLDDPEIATC